MNKGPFHHLLDASQSAGGNSFSSYLDVIAFFVDGLGSTEEGRDELFARLYNITPVPYWKLARWVRGLTPAILEEAKKIAVWRGWKFFEFDLSDPASFLRAIEEIVDRFCVFDTNLGGIFDPDSPMLASKYLAGRELARGIAKSGHVLGDSIEVSCKNGIHEAWSEWITANTNAGAWSPDSVVEGIVLATKHNVERLCMPDRGGVGRTSILLQEIEMSGDSVVAALTARILPLTSEYRHLDGLMVPHIPDNGYLSFSSEFLDGAFSAWKYVRQQYPQEGPNMLCLSVRLSTAIDAHMVSGRSAELPILAAIDSAMSGRSLRGDVVASASVDFDEAKGDLKIGPVVFGPEKYIAAQKSNFSATVVAHETADKWQKTHGKDLFGGPDVVAVEFFRRDAQRILESQSQWRVAVLIPLLTTFVFSFGAILWQWGKMGTSETRRLEDPQVDFVAIEFLVIFTELSCIVLSGVVLWKCLVSTKQCLDSWRLSIAALLVCATAVGIATFAPLGVREEGLIDNPVYSVLLGEPQVTLSKVKDAGGLGLLVLHTVSQIGGYVTILFGFSAFWIRLRTSRARYEPRFHVRQVMVVRDWKFSSVLVRTFVILLLLACIPRNHLWWEYLAYLPGIELGFRSETLTGILSTLALTVVFIVGTVGLVWAAVMRAHIRAIALRTEMYSRYSSTEFISGLPPLAKWLATFLSGN